MYLIASAFLCARFCFVLFLATSLAGAVGPAGPEGGASAAVGTPAVAAVLAASGTAVVGAMRPEGGGVGLGGRVAADDLTAGVGEIGAASFVAAVDASSVLLTVSGWGCEDGGVVVMPCDRRAAA